MMIINATIVLYLITCCNAIGLLDLLAPARLVSAAYIVAVELENNTRAPEDEVPPAKDLMFYKTYLEH